MKALALSALALAILTEGALAQASAPPAPAAPASPGMQAPLPADGPGAMDDDGPGGPPPPAGGPHGRRPPPSKAAHFRLRRGDIGMDVKCPEDEPMKACADTVLQMLDRLQAPPKP